MNFSTIMSKSTIVRSAEDESFGLFSDGDELAESFETWPESINSLN